jgi:hypothetical protein
MRFDGNNIALEFANRSIYQATFARAWLTCKDDRMQPSLRSVLRQLNCDCCANLFGRLNLVLSLRHKHAKSVFNCLDRLIKSIGTVGRLGDEPRQYLLQAFDMLWIVLEHVAQGLRNRRWKDRPGNLLFARVPLGML